MVDRDAGDYDVARKVSSVVLLAEAQWDDLADQVRSCQRACLLARVHAYLCSAGCRCVRVCVRACLCVRARSRLCHE
jgi:hypothetical protein